MTAQTPAALPIRTILKATISQVDRAKQAVARTPEEWQKLWLTHNFDAPPPAVDFSKEMVVAVFMGSRPTAGFAVEIAAVREDGGALVVQYRETRPRPDMMQAQVITSPCHLAAIPKRDGPVRFEKIE